MQFSCKKLIFLLRKWKKRPKNEKKIAAKPRARRAVCTPQKTKIWRFLKREYRKWSQRAILSRLAKEFSKKLDWIFLSGSSKLGSILGNLLVGPCGFTSITSPLTRRGSKNATPTADFLFANGVLFFHSLSLVFYSRFLYILQPLFLYFTAKVLYFTAVYSSR